MQATQSERTEQRSQKRGRERILSPFPVLVIVLIGVLFGASASIFVRFSTAPALVLAAYRKTIVTFLLLPAVLLKFREELLHLEKKTLAWCALSGCFLGIHFLTYFLAVQNTSIVATHVLGNTEVLFTAAFMFFTGKEQFRKQGILGIGIAIAGGLLVAWSGNNGESRMFGNLCGLGAAITLAAYSLVGAKVRKNCSTTVYTFLVYGVSALFLDLLVPLAGYSWVGYEPINLLTAFCMAVLCSLMGHSVFNWALKYLSPTVISMARLTSPVLAALLAFLLLRELPSWNQLLGGVIVLCGLYLYIQSKRQPAAAVQS